MGEQNSELREQIEQRGFVFLPKFRIQDSSEEAIESLGSVEQISDYDDIHDLKPQSAESASKGSYSGNFGCGEFPLHTDFAHWFTPPRYLVLRCVVGASDVATRILDSSSLIEEIGPRELSRAIFQARTPINGQRPLLRMLDRERGPDSLFRWDSLFLVPSSPHGRLISEKLNVLLSAEKAVDAILKTPGDTLVVDNWRVLHGRSPVPDSQRSRKIHRAYLSSLK